MNMSTSGVLKFVSITVGVILTVFSFNAYAVDWYQNQGGTNLSSMPPSGHTDGAPSGYTYTTCIVAGLDSTSTTYTKNFLTYTNTHSGTTSAPQNCGRAFTCRSDYVFNGVYGTGSACVTAPPPTCSKPSGTKSLFVGAGEGSLSDFCGADNCNWGVDSTFGSPEATANHPANSYTAYVTSKGTACTPSVGAPGPVGISSSTVFDQTSKGTWQSQVGSACGTFNGDKVCPGAIPNGSCVTTEKGNTVCAAPPGATRTSPPTPDTGTPGTPAVPSVVVGSSNAPGSATSVYNSSTSATSTTHAPSGSATGTSTGTGDTTDPTAGKCGAAGEPACKIDETGTPTTAPDFDATYNGQYDSNAGFQSIVDASSNAPSKDETGGGLAGLSGMTGITASCEPIIFTYKGVSYNFSTPSFCSAWSDFRDIFGLLLLAGVGGYLIHRAIEVM